MEYSEYHQDDMLPIVFVITKADMCADYISNEEVSNIMQECFGFLMTKGTGIRFYVTMVTLGKEIADNGYLSHFPEFLFSIKGRNYG